MEKISRSGFLKLAAAAAMSGVTAGALTACNNRQHDLHRKRHHRCDRGHRQ